MLDTTPVYFAMVSDTLVNTVNDLEISRILVVDDHPAFRRGMTLLLARQRDFSICGEAEDYPTALKIFRRLLPDLAVLDINLPGGSGLQSAQAMLAEQPNVKILVVSIHVDLVHVLDALHAGARGYVSKSDDGSHVVAALKQIVRGCIYISPQFEKRRSFRDMITRNKKELFKRLTSRERQVLLLSGEGFHNHEAAAYMEISMSIFHAHLCRIMSKLHLDSLQDIGWFGIEWVSSEIEANRR